MPAHRVAKKKENEKTIILCLTQIKVTSAYIKVVWKKIFAIK